MDNAESRTFQESMNHFQYFEHFRVFDKVPPVKVPPMTVNELFLHSGQVERLFVQMCYLLSFAEASNTNIMLENTFRIDRSTNTAFQYYKPTEKEEVNSLYLRIVRAGEFILSVRKELNLIFEKIRVRLQREQAPFSDFVQFKECYQENMQEMLQLQQISQVIYMLEGTHLFKKHCRHLSLKASVLRSIIDQQIGHTFRFNECIQQQRDCIHKLITYKMNFEAETDDFDSFLQQFIANVTFKRSTILKIYPQKQKINKLKPFLNQKQRKQQQTDLKAYSEEKSAIKSTLIHINNKILFDVTVLLNREFSNITHDRFQHLSNEQYKNQYCKHYQQKCAEQVTKLALFSIQLSVNYKTQVVSLQITYKRSQNLTIQQIDYLSLQKQWNLIKQLWIQECLSNKYSKTLNISPDKLHLNYNKTKNRVQIKVRVDHYKCNTMMEALFKSIDAIIIVLIVIQPLIASYQNIKNSSYSQKNIKQFQRTAALYAKKINQLFIYYHRQLGEDQASSTNSISKWMQEDTTTKDGSQKQN